MYKTRMTTGADQRRPFGARTVALCAAGLVACVLAAVLVLSAGPAALSSAAWSSETSGGVRVLFYGAILAGCLLVLAVLCGMMWAAGRAARRSRTAQPREQGGAIIEFTLVMPFALMIVLLMTQATLLMGGQLCVNYASFCAARSAIVYVPRNLPDEPSNVVGDPASSTKIGHMKMAAIWAVLPVSCANPAGPSVNASQIESGLAALFADAPGGTPGWVRDLGHRLGYAQEHTTVELNPPANGVSYDGNEDLSVRVRHDFYLSVPYVSRIFSYGNEVALDFGSGQYAAVIWSQCKLTNEGVQDYVDVEQFPRDRHRN